jgi:glycosyltransferase involved in cell wall biosynthesis
VLSVITVVLNGRDCLEETIRSVLGQTYTNVEYILIDGGSTDGTLDIVRQFADRFAYWCSEADNGIFDAMNRGAALATGEWLNFMNAGDRFYDSNVVSRIFSRDCSHDDLIYGNVDVNYGGRFSRKMQAGRPESLWKGMNFSHQSAFMRTALVRDHGFNVGNRICADFELIYRLKHDGRRFVYINETIASVQAGGVSDVNRIAVLRSHWQVVAAYGKTFKVTTHYCLAIADSMVRDTVKSLLPQSIIDKIIRWKR